jgi:hypothetical protein
MRDVVIVGENQLKRMLTRGKRNFFLGLAVAEMNVIQVARQRPIQRWGFDIYHQVMMAGIRLDDARRRYAHVAQAEPDR